MNAALIARIEDAVVETYLRPYACRGHYLITDKDLEAEHHDLFVRRGVLKHRSTPHQTERTK